MSKWKCVTCSENCKLELESKPVYCMVDGGNVKWEEVKEEAVTHRNQLPKLTTEVFDRIDCPEWAKWAAVDESGEVLVYASKPHINISGELWAMNEMNNCKSLLFKADTSNWQNSLIERPAKALPDWVEVGGYVYDARNGYGKIVSGSVKSCYIEYNGGAGDFVSEDFAELKQARLRPYTTEEMRELVGKVLIHPRGNYLVTFFANELNQIKVAESLCDADELLQNWVHLDKTPCGVLEHYENGEWVK